MRVFLVLAGFIGILRADVLKIETNNWRVSRDLTWTCRFLRLDRLSGIAEFEYMNGEGREVFSVHVTRIYSLVIDDDSRVNRSFPSTRENLEMPLPTDRNQPRSIELTNQHFAEDQIPEDVRQRSEGGKVFLSGSLASWPARLAIPKKRCFMPR